MAANKERKKSVLFFSLISKNSKLNFDKRFLSRSVFTRFSFFFLSLSRWKLRFRNYYVFSSQIYAIGEIRSRHNSKT